MADDTPYLDITTTSVLFERAAAQADSAPREYQTIVRLYYVARYMVSVFEAHNQELPLQVWNEYRNALDHFARHLTTSSHILQEGTHRHLSKMEGHIQRAALDACKFLCIYFDDFYKRNIEGDTSVLSLVSDGEFLQGANETYQRATTLLLQAKQQDSDLGEEAATNRDVIMSYCDAAFAFMRIERTYRQNNRKVVQARIRHRGLQVLATKKQLLINALVAAIAGAFFFLLGANL